MGAGHCFILKRTTKLCNLYIKDNGIIGVELVYCHNMMMLMGDFDYFILCILLEGPAGSTVSKNIISN